MWINQKHGVSFVISTMGLFFQAAFESDAINVHDFA